MGIQCPEDNFILNYHTFMDPRSNPTVNRAGSLGTPPSARLNQSQAAQQQPEGRLASSVNVNRAASLAGTLAASGLTGAQVQASNFVSGPSPRVDNDLEGEFYDQVGESQAMLTWSILPEDQNLVIQGSSDYNILARLKNILLSLRDQFVSGSGKVVITGNQRENLDQRMILLEGEIDGLMKRRISYTVKDTQGGQRVMDYTNLLNQKENQVVELEKKINNLEERLRRSTAREQELENHIQILHADLKRKDIIIRSKNDQILEEVAASVQFRDSINRVKKNIDQYRSQLGNGLDRNLVEGVVFPDPGSLDIKADVLTKDGSAPRGSSYSGSSSGFQYKTQLVSLFREFERLNKDTGIVEADFERILEGFLVGLRGNRLGDVVNTTLESRRSIDSYNKLKEKFNVAVNLYRSQIDRFGRDNPSLRVETDKNLIDLLENDRVTVDRIDGGVVFMERFSEKTIEVPVQDTRTKHLLHLFAVELKNLTTKYPKLLSEINVKLSEFFQQELIDIIDVDEVDRVIEIVKYVPQVVKVENVYAYSNEKSRKVEFHLRVLVKALLEELEKLKIRHGLILDIDEGVIGMINQEIMGVVDVDDILKVFRVVPKIVEVEKIVQKIVDRVVQVPEVITIQKIVEKIVEIQKIREVEKIVNIPLQVPTVVNNIIEKIVPVETIIQKVIEVPTVVDRIVEVTREVPKIVEVERIVERIVEVEKVMEVERQVNHFVPEIKEVIVYTDKIVTVETIVQKIVEVPTYVEKIVERYVEVPQIIEVQKIVEKIVEKIEYRIEKEMIPYVQIEHRIVERIVEKPIPIIQKEQRIIQVAQVIEKIVEVRTVQQELKEVIVYRDNIIIQEKILEIEKEVPHVITVKEEVEKIVEKRVEIPFIVEKLVVVQEIVTKPVIQRVETTIIKEVEVRNPLIVKEPVIVEVEKQVIHYIDVPRVVKHFEERIVEVPKHIEIIKEVRVNVDKIIEKMVEVPKVVEVERIVEKVVVVPRVIEKIVEIVQIVEVPVERIIIQEVIKEVQKIVQVPVFQERIVEVEKEKIIYVQVDRVVEKVVDKIVTVEKFEERIVTNDIIQERVVEIKIEVPKEIEVQKIVTNVVEREHVVQIERPQVIPVEIRYPVEKIIEKLVPVYETKEIIQQIPQIIQRIVEVKVPELEIREIQQIIKEVVVDTKIVEVPSERIVIQDQIREVEVIREKPVPITTIVQEIVTAERIVEKVIERTTQIPKVYEVEKIVEKIVETPQIVEIETLVPQLIRVKEYIQHVVQKIVEVPLILERIKEIEREKERVVEVHTRVTEIKEVQRIVQKAVIIERFKEAVKNINHIEQVLQIVDRFEQMPVEIHTREEKLVEVPHILQKIVEKIVVMPQIVEVLKYVHEVVETESLGVAVGVDVATHEQKYKLLSKDIQFNLDILVKEMNGLVKTTPALRNQIEVILKFLTELNQFILFPRIVQIPVERIVERIVQKDNIVRIPVQDERSLRMELTLSLLVEKLLLELKRVRTDNPDLQFRLDDDINLIFFNELGSGSNLISGDLNSQLKTFSDAVQRKFETLGSWTVDHQMMLNSFLQERFVMANIVKNCNMEIEKAKAISQKRLEGLRRYKTERIGYETQSRALLDVIPRVLEGIRNNPDSRIIAEQLENATRDFNRFVTTQVVVSSEPMRTLEDLQITDDRVNSLIRTKDAEISKLREQLFGVETEKIKTSSEFNDKTVSLLQSENNRLKNDVSKLQTKLSDPRINAGSDVRINNLRQDILKLEQEKADLNAELVNTTNMYKTKLQLAEKEIEQLTIRLATSSKISYAEGTPSRNLDDKNQGSNFGTPVTGPRRSPQDENIKTVQSGYYAANTPGSTVSQQSGVSNSFTQNQPSSGIVQSQNLTSYGGRDSTPNPPNQTSGLSGSTANFGSNSGRMTNSRDTGSVSGSVSGSGTGPSSYSGSSAIGGIAGTSSGISGTASQRTTSTTNRDSFGRDSVGTGQTPTGTTYGPPGSGERPGSRYTPNSFSSSYGTGSLAGQRPDLGTGTGTDFNPTTGGRLGSTYGTGTGNGTGTGTGANRPGSFNPTQSLNYPQYTPGNFGSGSNYGSNQSTNAANTTNPPYSSNPGSFNPSSSFPRPNNPSSTSPSNPPNSSNNPDQPRRQ